MHESVSRCHTRIQQPRHSAGERSDLVLHVVVNTILQISITINGSMGRKARCLNSLPTSFPGVSPSLLPPTEHSAWSINLLQSRNLWAPLFCLLRWELPFTDIPMSRIDLPIAYHAYHKPVCLKLAFTHNTLDPVSRSIADFIDSYSSYFGKPSVTNNIISLLVFRFQSHRQSQSQMILILPRDAPQWLVHDSSSPCRRNSTDTKLPPGTE